MREKEVGNLRLVLSVLNTKRQDEQKSAVAWKRKNLKRNVYCYLFVCFVFESRVCYVAQAVLGLVILLPQPPLSAGVASMHCHTWLLLMF